jgi:hypothetical protein
MSKIMFQNGTRIGGCMFYDHLRLDVRLPSLSAERDEDE